METPATYTTRPNTRVLREARKYAALPGSKALVNEYTIPVVPSLAKALGINGAVLLQQIHYWLLDIANDAKPDRFIDGHWWVYNSYREWCKQLPWMSIKTMQRTAKLLEEKGLIVTGNFNKANMDRTFWYTIDYAHLDAYYDAVKMTNGSGQNDKCMWPICPDACGQNDHFHVDNLGAPIPETTTETTTETNNQEIASLSQSAPEVEVIETKAKPPKKVQTLEDVIQMYGKESPQRVLKEIEIIFAMPIPRFGKQIKDTKLLLSHYYPDQIVGCWKAMCEAEGHWIELSWVEPKIGDYLKAGGKLPHQKGQGNGRVRSGPSATRDLPPFDGDTTEYYAKDIEYAAEQEKYRREHGIGVDSPT